MTRRVRRLGGILVGAAVMWLAPAARAEPSAVQVDASPAPRLRTVIEAPCADETELWLKLRARSRRIVRARPGEDAERVEIVVSGSGDVVEGTLRIAGDGGAAGSVRRVEGRSCEEVVDALSLAVALAYDPQALVSPTSPPPPPAPPPPPPARGRVVAPRPARPAAQAPPAWRVAAGAHATAFATRTWPVGGDAFAEARSTRGARPALRVSFAALYARARPAAVAGASASFTWMLVVPEVCPVRFGDDRLGLSPCAGFAMGLLSGSPEGIAGGLSYTRAWLAPRATARASFAVAPRLAIEGQLSVEVPLMRGRFTFRDAPVLEVPLLVPGAALGLSYLF